jgi:hypothetical protein
MSDITDEPIEDEITSIEISDESLEAAACVENSRAYLTQIAWCTIGVCPGG